MIFFPKYIYLRYILFPFKINSTILKDINKKVFVKTK